MDSGKVVRFIVAIVLCQVVGASGSIFTFPNIPNWYASLAKPFFAPPNWLFGPAWTTLFFLMGVALFLVWENKEKKLKQKRKIALIWFAIQFFFNVLWSFLFFGLRSPLLGFIGIIILGITITATILSFNKVSKRAAWLLIPYIAWVSFATILNFSIMLLNP